MPRQIGSLTLYSVDDLHEMLGLSRLTLRNYFRSGRLKGRKLGVSWYITEESLRAYFEEGADSPDSPAMSKAERPAQPRPAPKRRRADRAEPALRYIVQGLNDLVSEQEICHSVSETLDCIRAQAIVSLFEVVVVDPESGVELERIRAREFLERHTPST